MTEPLKLRIREPDDDDDAVFQLTGETAILGRDDACDIVIEAASVSSRHALLKADRSGYTFTDLGSSNGSAIARGGKPPTPLGAGEAVPLSPGDVLLLGDAKTPVRVVIELGASAFGQTRSMEQTVIAAAPLAKLLSQTDDSLVTLAAQTMAAPDVAELANVALSFLRAVCPKAERLGVQIWGAGIAGAAGTLVPRAIHQSVSERAEVVLFESASDPLPTSQSVVAQEVRAALAAPLLVDGAHLGVMAAWSSLGATALPKAAMGPLAVASTLVGLGAAQLVRRAQIEAENARLRKVRPDAHALDPIGQAPRFVRTVELARSVATSDIPVLVLGETGTGKEVLSRGIHRWSPRRDAPFIAFNCAAVPEALIESELFGHMRGAFTGAGADRKGLFEEADGGTIFLDEIGEMPPVMQAKLLRVLQDGEIRRVGAGRTTRVDVRVVSATHRDLEALVAEGRFRADLMYRLNTVTMEIPALRDRAGDIVLLAHFLLGRVCERANKQIPGFSTAALGALSRYDFPGNVRELENEVQRAVALTAPGEAIQVGVFSDRVAGDQGASSHAASIEVGTTLKDAVADTERRVIEATLQACNGNVARTARELGLSRPGLYKVMERLGLR
ncbi:MAG: transcriptional regulator with GAF, ATPase, and Fis domain [Myxococcota bacterium]